ncbi:hypothetical protein A2707_04480 [Candidatus Saccharibacteria bacterium RIFCSPHIGHO2_01_FULL_45_15]|nr:MAG: hypothetical protein A2707_04480 [Candidatus Saccharibacteria bacterium RIFCSPHIGHO2_01_FULL_45_15]OGL27191.1 MAG: hypothetical protein A3C39_01365 [Candidatus Saccharibacteria bacterium RIFCSPHIGHO2_02_FULL_46_12]OGL32766.1 MAG: hypothetical protein A3E76_05480 [Candidatus Saccharibacteria bacterium RIFCSPHIGHO2_12_FULL_44_22]
MQPNNQQGNWGSDTPQPIQPVGQPLPAQPPVPQQTVTPVQPISQQPTATPVTPVSQPQPVTPQVATAPQPQPVQEPQQLVQPQTVQGQYDQPQQATPAAESLGAVAVGTQVEDGYYTPEELDDDEYDEAEVDLTEPVTWQASEYIHQEKGTTWFIIFGVVLAIGIGLAVWQQAWTFIVLLIVIAITIVVFAKRPPRVLDYSLSNDGLNVDQTLHRFTDFKSFGIIRDGEEFSVMLIPRRRFQPGITVYFPEEAGEDIVDALGSRLPMKDLHLDAVDRLVRKLRL